MSDLFLFIFNLFVSHPHSLHQVIANPMNIFISDSKDTMFLTYYFTTRPTLNSIVSWLLTTKFTQLKNHAQESIQEERSHSMHNSLY
jgi:Na+/H+ antiporter NhaD/arsenite permease-like protein